MTGARRLDRAALRDAARAAWKRLRGGELHPRRAAGSVALGLFIGCSPFYGLHVWLCLGLSLLFRLDFPLAWLCTNVSNPLVIPFLVAAEVQIGARLGSGRWLALSVDDLYRRSAIDYFGYAVLGAGVVGAAVAALGAVVAWWLAAWRRRCRG